MRLLNDINSSRDTTKMYLHQYVAEKFILQYSRVLVCLCDFQTSGMTLITKEGKTIEWNFGSGIIFSTYNTRTYLWPDTTKVTIGHFGQRPISTNLTNYEFKGMCLSPKCQMVGFVKSGHICIFCIIFEKPF